MKSYLFLLISAWFILSCNKEKTATITESAAKTDTLLQKDGTVLTFEKHHVPLIKMKRDQSQYSTGYAARLEKIAQYYLANTQQSLVKYQLENPDASLGYSVEENDWEDVDYTQIGIFNKSGSNVSTLQWLFYEPNSQKLYEFDLNKKQLQEFPMK